MIAFSLVKIFVKHFKWSLFLILYIKLIGFAYVGIGSWLISVLFTKPNFGFIKLYYTSMGAIMITVGILSTILAFYGYIISTKNKLYTAFVVCV